MENRQKHYFLLRLKRINFSGLEVSLKLHCLCLSQKCLFMHSHSILHCKTLQNTKTFPSHFLVWLLGCDDTNVFTSPLTFHSFLLCKQLQQKRLMKRMKSPLGFKKSFYPVDSLVTVTNYLIAPLWVTEYKIDNKTYNTAGLHKRIACKLGLIVAFQGNNQPEYEKHLDDRTLHNVF